jgi:hypothetical protein
MAIRMTMIAALAAASAWPPPALAQDAIPLASQRKQVNPPRPWPGGGEETGLTEPLYHPPLPAAPSLKAAQVGVRIEVGTRGYVTRCTVTKPSRHGGLNEESCNGLLFHRLLAAQDAVGRPMPATLDTIVRWRVGGALPPPPAPPVMLTTVGPPSPVSTAPGTLWPMPAGSSWTVNPTPRGDAGTWVTNDDYPPAALRAEQQGIVSFVLLLDAAGVPLDCAPTSSSGSSLLDGFTCDLLMTRARFNPARNAQGILVPSTWRSRMRWELPSD